MRLNKRAGVSGIEMVAILIIMLVAFLLMFGAGTTIIGLLKHKTDIEACRASVYAHATFKGQIGALKTIECPRREVVFYNDKVEIDGNKAEDFKELNNDIVNRYVAEELKNCWYMMGEGKLNVFKEELVGTNKVCLVCSEATFDKSLDKNYYAGLAEYLKNKKMPSKNVENITYSQYLWGENNIGEQNIGANKRYYFFFEAIKPGILSSLIPQDILNKADYLVVGPEGIQSTVTLGTVDKVSAFCDYLYN
ncbi:hypothetical protein HY638_00260 [Candidatus Woesearchaeota archaeon]|nr:hypothetical protein [Candidatus Woesearchaeota archaeon]